MALDESKRNRILDYSFKQFTTMGIPQVTMDDIARGLGMGKGTLYQYFPSKEELLLKTIEYHASRIESSIGEIFSNEKLMPGEKLSLYLKTVAEKLSSLNAGTMVYLERSMPIVYEKIEQTRKRIIITNMVRILKDGKENGLFDPQMDEYLVAHIMIGAVNHIIGHQVITSMEYTFDRLFNIITETILKGCLTEEGRRLSYPAKNTSH